MNSIDSRVITISVPSLMIITCMISILMFDTNIINNNTDTGPYTFSFNYANWENVEPDVSTGLLAIITTAAAIVAIGFSINHLTLTKVFESYDSPYIDYFFKKQKMIRSFTVLILIIIVSTMLLLLIGALVPPLKCFFMTSLTVCFIYTLGLFFSSFSQTFRLINKFNMMDDLKNDILKGMEDFEI